MMARKFISRRLGVSKNKIKWHPYPKKKPKKEDRYLVSIKDGTRNFTSASYWKYPTYMFTDFDAYLVTAWAKFPKPYKENK